MQRLYLTSYRFRGDLDDDDLQDLTKKFAEVGQSPDVMAHYVTLDGRGGFLLQRTDGEVEQSYRTTLQYGPWIEFQATPVTTIEEAFPVIQSVYG